MGWAIGYDPHWKRDIGYGVPAICDHPGCVKKIDRGLSYVCGGEPRGGDQGCGLFFCSNHLRYVHRNDGEADADWSNQLCERCAKLFVDPSGVDYYFHAKPDIKEWIDHKLTHSSWAGWRAEHPEFVQKYARPQPNIALVTVLVGLLVFWIAVAFVVEFVWS